LTFSADISLYWSIIFAIISLAIAVFVYKRKAWLKELPTLRRALLIGLRASTIFLILTLLMGILFEKSIYTEEKPVVFFLSDNSQSMLAHSDSAQVRKASAELFSKMKTELGERFDYEEIKSNENTVGFNGLTTDLSKGLNAIYEQSFSRNIGAVVLLSDGQFNAGANPLYIAEKFNLTPFFTIGVGDTTAKKDQYIKDVGVNDYAFLNNQFPVEVTVQSQGLEGTETNVTIYQNGVLLDRQKITKRTSSFDFQSVNFLIEAKKLGIQSYTIVIEELKGESSYQNNRRDFYVDVLESRKKILVLASSPHPDISAIRSVLEKEENVEIKVELCKNFTLLKEKFDLVIFHEPGTNRGLAINNLLIESKLPVWYFIGPQSEAFLLNKMSLGLELQRTNQVDDIEPAFSKNFLSFEISEDLQKALNTWAPLKSLFGQMKVSNSSETMLYQRLGTIIKKEPLQYFGNRNGTTYGVTFGTGVWRWKMGDFQKNQNQELFTEFIQKTVQYLSVEKDKSPFNIELPKRLNQLEEFIARATFYNKAMEPITSPTVKFTLTNEKKERKDYQFSKGDKQYILNAGLLDPGAYNWVASTEFNGMKYSKSGAFVVQEVQLEKLGIQAQHNLLRQIAEVTQGRFYKLKGIDQAISEIKQREDLGIVVREEKSFASLIDLKWLFILLFLFLGVEWFLRRYWGGY
jgi:hypothetical protein